MSSSKDLLSQFTTNQDGESDKVYYQIYLDDLLNMQDDIVSQHQSLQRLKRTIDDIIGQEVGHHIWHRGEPFHLEIVYPANIGSLPSIVEMTIKQNNKVGRTKTKHSDSSATVDSSPSSLLYLKGVTTFGENIEDEWYIVYLLMKITKLMPNISAQVFDNDGDFLMIETADYIPDWLGPENSLNRVWIKHGHIHIIPLEAPGQMKYISSNNASGPMKLVPALQCICQDPHCCQVTGSMHRIVSSRTTAVFPAKLIALEHTVACILPQWAARVFEQEESLVAAAIHAFSATESKDLSSTISQITIASNDSDDKLAEIDANTLVARRVRMTRTLYAQLTFKQFKIPRKYHNMMRRMSIFNSSKVSNAFNIGCRLVCGLDIAYAASLDERTRIEEVKGKNSLIIRHMLTTNEFLEDDVVENLSSSLLADPIASNMPSFIDDGDDGYILEEDEDTLRDLKDRFNVLFSNRANKSVADVVDRVRKLIRKSNISSEEVVFGGDQIAAQLISDDVFKSDDDSWMYMSPEQLDKEMQFRIDRFSECPHKTDHDSTLNQMGSDERKTPSHETALKETENEGNSMVDGDNDEIERLQKIVNEFKAFLGEKSEFDGIKNSSKSEVALSSPAPNLSSTTPDISHFDESQFDVNYLDSVLQSINLHIDGSVVVQEIKSSQGHIRDTSFQPGITGVGEKLINTIVDSRKNNEDDVESVDSDDEINDNEESDDEDGDGDEEDEEDVDHSPWNLDDLRNEFGNVEMNYRDASGDDVANDEDEDVSDIDCDEELSMEDFQVSYVYSRLFEYL